MTEPLERAWTEDTLAASETQLDTGRAPQLREDEDELGAGDRLARYLLLGRLGAGAMGVVYAAYDPKLDRKIALKLLARLEGMDSARARLEREAQALAKLAHPNVVAVYDVDVHEQRLYVAMELVAGRTLGAWLRAEPRAWPAVLANFLAAGRGLAAAHAAGLIHRDFKPENVMLGDDGRARVMDFGLARPRDAGARVRAEPELDAELEPSALSSPMTRTGTMMGTPAYMAPEQFEGRADARSDQFSFCVALYEGLYGQRPFAASTLAQLLAALSEGRVEAAPRGAKVPGWLRAAVVRGLAADPDARWPSMDALLEALADDPARRRRRWAGAALASALVCGALGGSAWSIQRQAQTCLGFEDRLEGVWDAPRRARIRAAFAATELPYAAASLAGTVQQLDDYAAAWVAARRAACEATQRGEQSGELLDLRMACLDERLQHLEASAALLEAPDEDVVRKAISLSSGLPPLARCADLEALSSARPPPEDPTLAARVAELEPSLIEAKVLLEAGKYERGVALAEQLVEQAEALGYEPLLARAWLELGDLQRFAGDYASSEQNLERAYAAALGLDMLSEAADAAAQLVYVVGFRLARPAEGRDWAKHAGPLTRAAGSLELEAAYLGSLGTVASTEGNYAEARGYYERALALDEQLYGPDSPKLGPTLSNLGLVFSHEGNYAEARAHVERALAVWEAAYGPDHPISSYGLSTLGNLARSEGKLDEAREHLERALALDEAALGPDNPHLGHALNTLGNVAKAQGELDEARTFYERTLQLWTAAYDADHPDLAIPLTNLGTLDSSIGRYADARARQARALEIQEQALGPDHPALGGTLVNLGETATSEGNYALARDYHARALQLWERTLGEDHRHLPYPLCGLAQALLELGEPEQARPRIERALEILAANPGDAQLLAQAHYVHARVLWEAPRADAGSAAEQAHAAAELAAASYETLGEAGAEELAELRAWQASHPR